MALVTPAEARAHLRVPDDYPEPQITVYLGAAVEQAQAFLNRKVYGSLDEMAAAVLAGDAGDDPMMVNDSIKAAVLLILGHLFAQREDTISGTIIAKVPGGSRALLQPWRIGLGV